MDGVYLDRVLGGVGPWDGNGVWEGFEGGKGHPKDAEAGYGGGLVEWVSRDTRILSPRCTEQQLFVCGKYSVLGAELFCSGRESWWEHCFRSFKYRQLIHLEIRQVFQVELL